MTKASELSFEEETSFIDEMDVSLSVDVETDYPNENESTNDGNNNIREKQKRVYTCDLLAWLPV